MRLRYDRYDTIQRILCVGQDLAHATELIPQSVSVVGIGCRCREECVGIGILEAARISFCGKKQHVSMSSA